MIGRVGPSAAWLLAGRVLSMGPLVLCTVILASRMGLAGFGHYAFVVALVYLANVITTFGTDMVLIREIAAERRVPLWSAALAVQLCLSAAAIGVIWLAAPLIPGQAPEVAQGLRLYAWSLLPSAAYSVCAAALRGGGRMSWYAALGLVTAGLQLATVWAFVPQDASVNAVILVLLAVQVASAVLGWAACAAWSPVFRRLPSFSRLDVVRMTRASTRIGLLGLLGVTYQRAAVVALGVLAGPAGTAWFAAAARIVDVSKSGHVALLGALYPSLSESRGQPLRAARPEPSTAWAWRLSIAGAAGIAVILMSSGPRLVALLYGGAFAPTGAAITLLALALVPSTIANYQSVELLAARRESSSARALATSLLVLVVLLATLIPAIGWIGACWAVLGAETVQAALLLRATGRAAWSRSALWAPDARRATEDVS